MARRGDAIIEAPDLLGSGAGIRRDSRGPVPARPRLELVVELAALPVASLAWLSSVTPIEDKVLLLAT